LQVFYEIFKKHEIKPLEEFTMNPGFKNFQTIKKGEHLAKCNEKDELVVNLKIARFFTKNFLHLLGYRSRRIDEKYLKVKNRESASRNEEYEDFF